ncbi:MAG: hypothetical protein CUN53_09250 [Phototrophicales bacterium]|nr:MAG: hypothetical protein CUN53_09250 [Phototrophicales bacterium]
MAKVFAGRRTLLSPILRPVERAIYRIGGVDAEVEQDWRAYAQALLAILYAGGLKHAEAAALAVEDFDPVDRRIVVQRGKGNKQRAVYIAGGALLTVQTWLKQRGDFPKARCAGADCSDLTPRPAPNTCE